MPQIPETVTFDGIAASLDTLELVLDGGTDLTMPEVGSEGRHYQMADDHTLSISGALVHMLLGEKYAPWRASAGRLTVIRLGRIFISFQRPISDVAWTPAKITQYPTINEAAGYLQELKLVTEKETAARAATDRVLGLLRLLERDD